MKNLRHLVLTIGNRRSIADSKPAYCSTAKSRSAVQVCLLPKQSIPQEILASLWNVWDIGIPMQ